MSPSDKLLPSPIYPLLNNTGDFNFYKALLDDMITFVAVLDVSGTIIFVNNTPLIAAGITLDDIQGTKFWDAAWWAYSPEAIKRIREDAELCARGENIRHEIQLATADGTLIWIEYSMHGIRNAQGDIEYLIPEGRDITERKQQEELLRRTQKMDALGKLTGGIAHDYNNLLGAISGFAELLSEQLVGDPKLQRYVKNIQDSATRGSKLTRKLLSFTKQKASEITSCNINSILEDQQLLVEKTLTAKIKLQYLLHKHLWNTDLDKNDLEDCLLNICINAMHAMENGGNLSLRTSNEHIDDIDAKALDIKTGAYVTLSIADTGCGMTEDTIEKIFDPFFSTKGEQGTGLGMSQVFGFMQRCQGYIKVYSKLDKGTRITLYFPRSNKKAETSSLQQATPLRNLSGNESILIVDDEELISEYAVEMLQTKGYKVFAVNSAEKALKVLKKHPIDAVVTDIVMPEMNGYELANLIETTYPHIKIQLVSGFEGGLYNNSQASHLRDNIIYKPYTSLTLLTHLRDLLEQKKRSKPNTDCTILVMDDDDNIAELFSIQITNIGCMPLIAKNGKEAIQHYQHAMQQGDTIDLVILDLNIEGGDGGIEIAKTIKKLNPKAKIILCSGDPEDERMQHYKDYGFSGKLEKPCRIDAIKKHLP